MMWTREDIPDLSGKSAVVTGANSGIGFEIVWALASKGAAVVMACRDTAKGEEAAERILKEHPGSSLEVMALDLADLASVRTFAESFANGRSSLDVLCNNAGVMAIPNRQETVDGFEMQFGTNHLGHFALTGLLLDLILQTSAARVVTVSSLAARSGKVEFDNMNSEKFYERWQAYGLSKLANLLFSNELQRRLESVGKDVIAVASHPGLTKTNLSRYTGVVYHAVRRILFQTASMGALPTLYAATAIEVKGGEYYGPSGMMEARGYPRRVKLPKASLDEEVAKRLWEVSEELTGVQYTF